MTTENQLAGHLTSAESSSNETMDAQLSQRTADAQLLRRVGYAMSKASDVLLEESERCVFVVHIPDAGPPVVTEHTTREEAGTRVLELKMLADADRNGDHYVLVFCGTRWHIVKGRTWKLFDGKEMIALRADLLEDHIDRSGLLSEPGPATVTGPTETVNPPTAQEVSDDYSLDIGEEG